MNRFGGIFGRDAIKLDRRDAIKLDRRDAIKLDRRDVLQNVSTKNKLNLIDDSVIFKFNGRDVPAARLYKKNIDSIYFVILGP